MLGLVPMLGAFGHPAETFLDPRIGRAAYQAGLTVGRRIPDVINVVSKAALRSPIAWPFARLAAGTSAPPT